MPGKLTRSGPRGSPLLVLATSPACLRPAWWTWLSTPFARPTYRVASWKRGSSGPVRWTRPAAPPSAPSQLQLEGVVCWWYSVMGGSQELMRGIARSFALHHGVTACTLNLRGVGGSSGMPSLTGSSEVADVAAVGAWLQQAGFTHCLLVCSSAGGPIGGSALDRVPAFTGCAARCTACSSASPP
jgi:hypothetical protein